MAAAIRGRGCLLCLGKQLPQTTQVRYKINFTVRKSKIYQRPLKYRIFKEITRPIEYVDESKEFPCPRLERLNQIKEKEAVKEVNPFDKYMERKCQRMFRENQLIVVCQPLPCPADLNNKYKASIIKAGLGIATFNNTMVKKVSEEFGYGAMHPWLIGHNVYIVCYEPKVSKLLKTLKKIPVYVLLGGIVDKQILSKTQLQNYGQMPAIEHQLGELVSILGMAAGGRTHSLLGQHQQQLSTNLEQYIKQNSDNTDNDQQNS